MDCLFLSAAFSVTLCRKLLNHKTMTNEQINKLAYQVHELVKINEEISETKVRVDISNALGWLAWAIADSTKKEEE